MSYIAQGGVFGLPSYFSEEVRLPAEDTRVTSETSEAAN
jgi:hypothetical protein